MTGEASKPSFFWQGVLILLPLIIMAGITLAAITQDRATVEREARRRAEEIAQQFRSSLEQRWAAELARLDALSSALLAQSSARQRWPGDAANLDAALTNYTVLLSAWKADYPDLPFTNSLNYVDFLPDGKVRFPPGTDFPPQPASFSSKFSASQREAWKNLKKADIDHASPSRIEDALKAFLATDPDAEAVMNAQVIALRNRLQQMPPADAINQAITFIQSHHLTNSSEAGIPLSALLMNDAIQCSQKIGPSKRLWDGIGYIVQVSPSFMTPRLLDDLANLAVGNARLEENVQSWRDFWQSQEQLRELALAVQNSGKVRGLVATNFWIGHGGSRWFCSSDPMQIIPESTPIKVNAVHLYSGAFVAGTLRHSLGETLALFPNYLNATVNLDGEIFAIPPSNQNPRSDPEPQLLAETHGRLTQVVQQTVEKPGAVAPLNSTVDFEAMPSHPEFNVSISLIDPTAMFAQHRQRVLMLGGLIIGSGLAALVGFLATRRAFTRQLQLSEAKSNFVSSVSHELRAPIASVRLMAESLERGKIHELQKQNEYFRFIVQECRRLSSLIENVLDFSRIEQGRKQYEFEPTDLFALTRETVKLMEPYAEEKGVRLETSLAAPEQREGGNTEHRTPNIEVEIDGRAIQQALVNLIDNAIKHSTKGQVVTVGIDMSGAVCQVSGEKTSAADTLAHDTSHFALPTPHVALYVEDRGAGIPAAEHEKIFERFYRLGSELRRETQGVGIGLSIVKHIVEAHGGKVIVRSTVGQGSRFTIELPLNNNSLNK